MSCHTRHGSFMGAVVGDVPRRCIVKGRGSPATEADLMGCLQPWRTFSTHGEVRRTLNYKGFPTFVNESKSKTQPGLNCAAI
jgi:hypothetical protein